MAITQHEADLINADRDERGREMRKDLERMGVRVRVFYSTGDSSWPVTYIIDHQGIEGAGPTWDMAVTAFIGNLLPEHD